MMNHKKIFAIFAFITITFSVFTQSIDYMSPSAIIYLPSNPPSQQMYHIYGIDTHFSELTQNQQIRLTQGNFEISPTNIIHDTDTHIRVFFNISSTTNPGSYNLVVESQIDGVLIKENAFYIFDEDIEGTLNYFDPVYVQADDEFTLEITGNDCHFGFNDDIPEIVLRRNTFSKYPTEIEIVDYNTIHASFVFPSYFPRCMYDIHFESEYDGNQKLFQVVHLIDDESAPHISSVLPNISPQNETLEVTVTAQNTTFNQASATVWFTQGTNTVFNVQNVVVENETTLKATVSTGNANYGFYDVNVASNSGTLNLEYGFLINPLFNNPHITSVSPSEAPRGQTISITINTTGTHFLQATDNTRVWLKRGYYMVEGENLVVNDYNKLKADFTFPHYFLTGYYDVYIENPLDHEFFKYNSFNLTVSEELPDLSNISTNNMCPADYLSVSVTGTNTNFNQGSPTVSAWLESEQGEEIDASNIYAADDSFLNALFFVENPGYYDLHIWDYIDGNIVSESSVYVYGDPDTPETPTGSDYLCLNSEDRTYFVNNPNPNFTYEWQIQPPEAGEIFGNNLSADVSWTESYSGDAYIQVAAHDNCGVSEYSEPLQVFIEEFSTQAAFDYENNDTLIVSFTNNSIFADEYMWDFGDGSTSIEINPVHVFPEEGYYIVTLSAWGFYCTVDEISFEIYVDDFNAIADYNSEYVNVYPNPVKNKLFFSKQVDSICLYNLQGELILRSAYTDNIKMDKLAPGTYLLKFITGNKTVAKKIVKH
jgi:hypothetical protein